MPLTFRILTGDCRASMDAMEPDSVDAIVTDPPYGLTQNKKGGSGEASVNLNSPAGRARITCGFMGQKWDGSVPGVEFWTAALRVAKPGAHLVAFGGTRTYHRLTCAIEDAGWEIRDCLSWLYGSGFPKSLDVSKAIDKAAGAVREVVGAPTKGGIGQGNAYGVVTRPPATAPATEWEGWGTALKPAWEPVILARKPLRGTVAANVQRHGTGALNVDACRIGMMTGEEISRSGTSTGTPGYEGGHRPVSWKDSDREPQGRWPANVLLDEEAASELDAQSGELTSGANPERRGSDKFRGVYAGFEGQKECEAARGADSGGASRFFYTAKASRSERNDGLHGFEERKPHPPEENGRAWDIAGSHSKARANFHPTVKPVDLMGWLCRLVTRPGGVILDPFMGSGSTGVAAIAGGFNFIGCEIEPEYVSIARARIASTAPLLAKEVL